MRQPTSFIFVAFCCSLSLGAMAEGFENGHRGDLIKVEKLSDRTWGIKEINASKAANRLDQKLFPTRSPVDCYRMSYITWNQNKKLVIATGIILVPSLIKTPLPLLSYQHGTRFSSENALSEQSFDPEIQLVSVVFASQGYGVVIADYLGLIKNSKETQSYLVAEVQAITIADMLSAAKEFFRQKQIALSEDLYLAGYSQGGYATLALHRYLQENQPKAYHIVASAALSAPLGLTELTRSIFKGTKESQISPVFVSLAFLGLELCYEDFPRMNEILEEPYGDSLPKIVRSGKFEEMARQLPNKVSKLFKWTFVSSLLLNKDAPFWRILSENDVDNFLPNAPVLLVHAKEDDTCPYESSQRAFERMKSLGADVRLITLGKKWKNHLDAAFAALPEAALFFKEKGNFPPESP